MLFYNTFTLQIKGVVKTAFWGYVSELQLGSNCVDVEPKSIVG